MEDEGGDERANVRGGAALFKSRQYMSICEADIRARCCRDESAPSRWAFRPDRLDRLDSLCNQIFVDLKRLWASR